MSRAMDRPVQPDDARVLLNPDCGFATFADNPIASADLARAKLRALSEAARVLRARHGVSS